MRWTDNLDRGPHSIASSTDEVSCIGRDVTSYSDRCTLSLLFVLQIPVSRLTVPSRSSKQIELMGSVWSAFLCEVPMCCLVPIRTAVIFHLGLLIGGMATIGRLVYETTGRLGSLL